MNRWPSQLFWTNVKYYSLHKDKILMQGCYVTVRWFSQAYLMNWQVLRRAFSNPHPHLPRIYCIVSLGFYVIYSLK